jgi:beta-glucanase (GH16 family)
MKVAWKMELGFNLILLCIVVFLVGPSVSQSDEPMPVGDIEGWHQIFADDFNGKSLNETMWNTYEGQPQGDPSGYFAKSHISVHNGALIISGYMDPNYDNKWVTGGVNAGASQIYGKYLVRFRVERGHGIAFAVLLWPSDGSDSEEIDFAEDNGTDRQFVTSTLWYSSVTGRTPIRNGIVIDLTRWHTVGVEWTDSKLVYTLDGSPWATVIENGPATILPRWLTSRLPYGKDIPSIPMTLCIQTQSWGCENNNQEACPDNTTPSTVNMEVDWAVLYAPN